MAKEDEVKKQLKWRLSERPTVESIEKLLKLGIIDKGEAKKLLLDEEEISPKSLKDLEKEIELLRELVLDIAKKQPSTVTIIEKFIDRTPYRPWKWEYIDAYYYPIVGSASVRTALSTTAGTTGTTLNTGDTINLAAFSSKLTDVK